MNLDNLMTWATGVVIAAALSGHVQDLEVWVWKAQAKLLYESRSSTWGSPHFFPPGYRINPATTGAHELKTQIFKTTTDRKIHSESRSH